MSREKKLIIDLNRELVYEWGTIMCYATLAAKSFHIMGDDIRSIYIKGIKTKLNHIEILTNEIDKLNGEPMASSYVLNKPVDIKETLTDNVNMILDNINYCKRCAELASEIGEKELNKKLMTIFKLIFIGNGKPMAQ